MPFVCKLCDLEFEKERKFWKHNFSKAHIQKINEMPESDIKIPNELICPPNKKNELDPQLNQSDVSKLNNTGVGNGINVNFNNNSESVNYNFETKTEPSYNNKTQTQEQVTSPTQKQKRIINYIIENQKKPEMTKTFFELLKKIDLIDYKLLGTHIISNNDIDLLEKQKLLRVIELFKNTLKKKIENKETVFNGNQISDIINLLS